MLLDWPLFGLEIDQLVYGFVVFVSMKPIVLAKGIYSVPNPFLNEVQTIPIYQKKEMTLYKTVVTRFNRNFNISYEPGHSIFYMIAYAPSWDSDQTAHPRSLNWVFAERSVGIQGSKSSSGGQRRFWSACADELNLSPRTYMLCNGVWCKIDIIYMLTHLCRVDSSTLTLWTGPFQI